MSKKDPNRLGFIARKKLAIDEYILIRKVRMKEQRDYFASKGESDPERLAAQKERDKEFIESLKKLGIAVLVFGVFYLLLRSVLGLW